MERIKEIAFLFFKLGLIAFGGPAAHIAMMEEEVVSKRKWMSREHFLDLVGATNLIPGPNSTEMAIHCGFHRAGWAGLITSGVCFIFPAALLTGLLAHLYVTYGAIPEITPFFYGIRPAVIAIILSAVWKLGKKAYKGIHLGVIGGAVVVLTLAGLNEIFAILLGGFVGMFCVAIKEKSFKPKAMLIFPLISSVATTAVNISITSSKIFFVFLKIGAVLFGSGYVLIAYLQGELVEKLGWITQQQLLDAVAMGQLTPGPVLTTATFIGYQLHGVQGAILATLGIFLPSFFFVAILNPIIPKMRQFKWTAYFLDAVNISAVGIMVAVVITLVQSFVADWRALIIMTLSIVVVFRWKKVNVLGVVAGGSVLGYLLQLL